MITLVWFYDNKNHTDMYQTQNKSYFISPKLIFALRTLKQYKFGVLNGSRMLQFRVYWVERRRNFYWDLYDGRY